MWLGLGVNSMEGREQKHQQKFRYMKNSTAQEKWQYVFRPEFISCVYLRENGFDQKNYHKERQSYIPHLLEGYCACSLKLENSGLCLICSSDEFVKLSLE